MTPGTPCAWLRGMPPPKPPSLSFSINYNLLKSLSVIPEDRGLSRIQSGPDFGLDSDHFLGRLLGSLLSSFRESRATEVSSRAETLKTENRSFPIGFPVYLRGRGSPRSSESMINRSRIHSFSGSRIGSKNDRFRARK